MNHKRTILVVDDMSQIRNILSFSLRKEGYEIKVAANGKDALKYALGDKPPDLIILDIMMPGMNGYEVIKKIRASDTAKDIPIIFLTANAQKKDVQKGIELGCNDYMVKPFKMGDLRQKIAALLNE